MLEVRVSINDAKNTNIDYVDTTTGDLSLLTTDIKDKIVNAINEIDGKLLSDVPIDAVFTDTEYDDTSILISIATLNADDSTSGSVDSKVKVVNDLVTTNTASIATLEPKSGETSSRPTTSLVVGLMYFDTDLTKPIWYTGSDWVDSTGTTV